MSVNSVTDTQTSSNMVVISEKYLYLTPRLFERLDLLARVYAGRPISVFDLEEARSSILSNRNWAEYGGMLCGIFRKGKQHSIDEAPVICLANKIPLEEIERSDRIELKPGEDIPLDCFYEWLVWHEIAHVRNGDSVLLDKMADGDIKVSKQTHRRLRQAMEIQADRESYRRLCPKNFPTKGLIDKKARAEIEAIEGYFPRLEKLRAKHAPKQIVPAPVTPGAYVPYSQRHGEIGLAREIEILIQ